ncbi:ribulose-phosphate 3-epimerase [Mycoplasma tauri]|uniref:Ribulose-phosphate 3-epimerase n=1 Tax=Mycoplasma tauri TaxID=547987 RepID=A0A953T4R7_9MOLU|nr:ribulose-phosphate 3-epimerase [Mycoplasma tauri]MBZ4195270.1 ribulose-phosphate 3-epimerase [Mycoplasma tauri]MBZ4203968.1 ribulose-phosphate 3-epimerase [Mycoplasma tauri]MBZ4204167.1 ribulose-phosphate 3-epimerase [Mycoplasma tauri]MBZ4212565.1 ribulose-phosphate 3-epimerase [Mycoplasma tauri]MBZ4218197.1 ribulose-phosphate 3-epimerase [Mycoplasma tauri]
MKRNNKYVTPSLLNVDKEKRLEMANLLVDNGIKWIHYDVMDGKFVPNHAIELEEIKNINSNGKKHFKDAHLMVENPLDHIENFKDHVDIITFHYEAVEHKKILHFLEENNGEYRIGIAIKPNTNVCEIYEFLPYIQLVLVMSVEPGKGGQKFIDSSVEKIKELKELRIKNQYDYLIQVDGGINETTGPLCFKAGADACVAGTYIVYQPTKERIESLLK